MQQLKKTMQKHKQQNQQHKNKQQTWEKNTKTTSTAHPAGTWDIFIRGRVVGWRMSCIFVVLLFVIEGFLFVFCCSFVFALSCWVFACVSEQTLVTTKRLREKQNTKIQLIQPEPERYLFAAEWWAGCPVFLFLEGFLFVVVCLLFLFCFCIVFLSFCLNTTQYTTLNTNNHETGLFMTCVKCPQQCSNSFQITWLSL